LHWSHGAPRGFYDPASKLGAALWLCIDSLGRWQDFIRGGFGISNDKVEGNLIFGQINLPPFISTPQSKTATFEHLGRHPSALAPLGAISAIDPT